MNRTANQDPSPGISSGRGQFAALAALCLISGFFLILDNYGILSGAWRFWPVFPLCLGLGGIWFFRKGGTKDVLTVGVGSFLFLISIFFFVLNYTSWSHMVKFWPTFIGVLGVSILAASCFAKRRRWLAISGIFFVFLSVIFFAVFTVNARLWPVSLMLFGIWILLVPERS